MAEYTGICCVYLTACVAMATYVAPCVQGFPSIRYYYSEWFIGYVNDENKYEIVTRWYSVAKLVQIGDRQRSHRTIKLSFWVSMILTF
ncbi:hypothetical protein F383_35196 [Gossypium arboreum]|uniref:Uncharacterized protein n=1 Tax=Gossypium arboreum TaxID=29729 RepID=A0A0B0N0P0_GOSAR|nr:hypothetical protein F383_35196 [Gossypium arboreum]